MDIMTAVYNVLASDDFVQSTVDVNRDIKYYTYPEIASLLSPYIVIDEPDDALPMEYADNDPMANSYLVEVNVYTVAQTGMNARVLCKTLNDHIKQIIWDELGMYNTSNSKPEYDKDYKIYRRASRYEGAFYNEKIN